MALPSKQYTRKEMYLNKLATGSGDLPAEPLNREEMYLDYIVKNGSIGGDGSGHTHVNKVELDSISNEDVANVKEIPKIKEYLTRIDKLEESTVSTVSTDKDFANVQATSQGYFEDVKLQGKTLVNLCTSNSLGFSITDSTIVKSIVGNKVTVEKTSDEVNTSHFGYYHEMKKDMITVGKDYTLVLNIIENTFAQDLQVVDNSFTGFDNRCTIPAKSTGIFKFKIKTSSGLKTDRLWIWILKTALKGKIVYEVPMIFEGDLTENSPSGYIDGLKSVGDGADEIVVSSVNENLFDKYNELIPLTKGDYIVGNIELGKRTQFKLYDKSKKIINHNLQSNAVISTYIEKTQGVGFFTTTQNIYILNKGSETGVESFKVKIDGYIEFIKYDNLDEFNLMVCKSSLPKPYTSHKADKKRILYLDPTDNTWKKPVLREWDTIEKHSDGKYYYHQRSIEENYVSGDESKADCITDMTKTVKKLAQEKVFECTNIDLITYANETNYVFSGGVISPKTSLKVQNNISNVVSTLQKKVSVLESYIGGLFRAVLAGDMRAVAQTLYPNDFVVNNEMLEGVENA